VCKSNLQEGKRMFEPKFSITHTITNALLEIERARGFLDAANLNEEWITEMQSEALILEAHHSTHIEGTQLTLAQAQDILAGKSLKGIRKELNLVRRTVQRDLSKLVTLGLIKEIAKSKTDPTKYYELL